MMRTAGLVLIPALTAFDVSATTHRDLSQLAAFQKAHPCPANGKTRGKCPGYVVDHVRPICGGGKDHPANMQWQTREAAKIKDREEWAQCHPRRI